MLVFQRGTLARILGTAIAIAVSGSADLQAERLPFHNYSAADGLAHDRIRCVLADSRGFLWFCTPDGLSRFDGSRFVNYGPEHGLPHPAVEEIVEAGPGVYWVATVGGLARLRSIPIPRTEVKRCCARATAPARRFRSPRTRWARTRQPTMCSR